MPTEFWSRIWPFRTIAQKRRDLGYDDPPDGVPASGRNTDSKFWESGFYCGGWLITWGVVFVGCWLFVIATFGFVFGVGLGWLPSVIVGWIAGALWPLLLLAWLIYARSVATISMNVLTQLSSLSPSWVELLVIVVPILVFAWPIWRSHLYKKRTLNDSRVRAERRQQFERLKSERESLEEQAGLSQVMERAREGSFIPLVGDNVSSQEYFAFEHDAVRRRTRDAYFSVADPELRKKLIAAQRKVESRIRQSHEEGIIAANRKVAIASALAQRQPWGKAALVAGGAVVLGYWAFDMVGAIAGAVAGFFLAQGEISAARNAANAGLAEASRLLEEAKKEEANHSLMPRFFSFDEEMSGNRDRKFDDESAWANFLRSCKYANGTPSK